MNNLKTVRKKRGLTQKEVADMLGVTIATYSRYESGQYEPSFENMEKLAKLFSVDITYLFNFKLGDIQVSYMTPEYIPDNLSSLYLTLRAYGLEIEKKDLKFYLTPDQPTVTRNPNLHLPEELYKSVCVTQEELEEIAKNIDEYSMFQAIKLYKSKLKQKN